MAEMTTEFQTKTPKKVENKEQRANFNRRDFLKVLGISGASLLRLGAAVNLFLAACSTDVSAATPIPPDGERQTATATIAPTEKTTPTQTEAPDLFQEVVLPEGTGELYKEGNQWFFNSPLKEADLGQHVEVVVTDQKNVDGETQTWLGLKEHPDWPLFIQNEDGSWRQAMRYVEVTERFSRADYGSSIYLWPENTDSFEISTVRFPDGFVGINGDHTLFVFSPVIIDTPYKDEKGNWIGVFALPIGGPEDPMVIFDMVLEPALAKNTNPSEPFLITYYKSEGVNLMLVNHEGQTPSEQTLTNYLSNNIGKQISVRGYLKIDTEVPPEGFFPNFFPGKIIVQGAIDGYPSSWKVISNLTEKNFIEAHNTGLYIWGFGEAFIE